jgi:hypothetical protein
METNITMSPTDDDYAEDFLGRLSDRSACQWCKHPNKRIYLKGLCRHCYDIRGKINRLHRTINEYKKKLGKMPLLEADDVILRYRNGLAEVEVHYQVAIEMEKDAKTEGEAYEQMYTAQIDGLTLEHQFSFISAKFVHQDLYHGDANLFDWSFTPNQKRLLSYLMSLMSSAYLRRTRWKRAATSHFHRRER